MWTKLLSVFELKDLSNYNYGQVPNGRAMVAIPVAVKGRETVDIRLTTGESIKFEKFNEINEDMQTGFANIIDKKTDSRSTLGLSPDLLPIDYNAMLYAKPSLKNITLAITLKRMKANGLTAKEASEQTGMSHDTVKKYFACFQPPPPIP